MRRCARSRCYGVPAEDTDECDLLDVPVALVETCEPDRWPIETDSHRQTSSCSMAARPSLHDPIVYRTGVSRTVAYGAFSLDYLRPVRVDFDLFAELAGVHLQILDLLLVCWSPDSSKQLCTSECSPWVIREFGHSNRSKGRSGSMSKPWQKDRKNIRAAITHGEPPLD